MSEDAVQPRDPPPAAGPSSAPTLFTLGYGARSVAELITLLREHRIEFLLDVRSAPYSKFKPEFTREPLEDALQAAGFRYVFMGDTLGGQPKAPDCHTDGKVDYAKVRRQPFFQAGIARLRKAHAQGRRVALMCSEGRPEQCHRSKLIGVALEEAGLPVGHLDETGRLLTQTQVMDRLTGGQLELSPNSATNVVPEDAPVTKPVETLSSAETELEDDYSWETARPAAGNEVRAPRSVALPGSRLVREGETPVEPKISLPATSPLSRTGNNGLRGNVTLPAGASPTRAREVLKNTFGFADFLPLQAEVIERLLARRDTLVVLPTGGGKSLCYQLPALLFEDLTVVVSPLIALMQDQVSQLRELDVPAAFLNSTLANREYVAITQQVRQGEIKILYVAPETLLRPETLVLLDTSRLSCFAVDEAHCISEWGHDFRPEYRQLQDVRRRFPRAVCAALTATATPRVRDDIRRLLGIPEDGVRLASFNRPNLALTVLPRRDGLGQVLKFLGQHRRQAGIIYCSTRKQVDQLAAELQARDWPALPYHAGLDTGIRRRNQEQFVRADDAIMVATVAFGMGIDKSDVRFVLHFNLPKDVESYYQEIGRSGRDGLPADCLLLHSRRDAITIRHFIDEGAASEAAGRQARLEAMIRYAETTGCRRVPLLGYFGENPDDTCGNCDNCLSDDEPAELTEVTEAAQKFLSCVRRTGEMFGAAHIIDVLHGSRSQKVLARGHDQLSTHGIGKEFSKEVWRDLARQFIEQGLLKQDLQHGGLSLTPKAWQVFKGEAVHAALKPVAAETRATSRAAAAMPEHDAELFELLRQHRRALADDAHVPAYVIFSDRSLVEMAARFPQTDEQFLEITGVGRAKLAHHGETFLQVIHDYCEPRGLKPRSTGASPPEPENTTWITGEKRRHQVVGERFTEGRTIEELAAEFAVKPGTILNHLAKWVQEGHRLNADRLLAASKLSDADRKRVFAAFEELGIDRLSPTHEALGGAVSYDELHLLRLYVLCR